MSQAEELLNALTEGDGEYPTAASEDEQVVITAERVVNVPASLRKIAVQYDHNVETVTFKCPRYWDDVDMFDMIPFINYMRPDGGLGSCECTNKRIDDTDESVMYFDWTLTRNVTSMHGSLKFLVCIKNADSVNGQTNHWNSELCTDMYISEGLESDKDAVTNYPDVITSILVRLNNVENSGASFFEGTRAEYEAANAAGQIAVGTIVLITDEYGDDDSSDVSTTSVLDEAILDQMILE